MIESAGSAAARADANTLGRVEGSSYSTHEDVPVVWAFAIDDGVPGERLIVGGAETTPHRVWLRVHENEPLTGMLYAKAMMSGPTPLTPGTTLVVEVPGSAAWYCDHFYASEEQRPGMREGDVLAVALHATERSPDKARIIAALSERTPGFLSTGDPQSAHPAFPKWCRLLRAMRRLRRLRELEAPETIIQGDLDAISALWTDESLRSLAVFPDDLTALADELALR